MGQSGGAGQGQASQGGGYQQYMKQYAGAYTGGASGGSGGSATELAEQASPSKDTSGGASAGGYDQYMKQYVGDGLQKYMNFGQKNWSKYQEKMNQQQANGAAIYTSQEAKDKIQLDGWRNAQEEKLNLYIPAAYSKFANGAIEKQYQQRLDELEHPKNNTEPELTKGSKDEGGAPGAGQMMLADAPLNVSMRKELEVEHLKRSSEEGVAKVESLLESIRGAAHDDAAIEKTADLPVEYIKAKFFERHKALSATIKTLQAKALSADDQPEVEAQLAKTKEEAEKLRADELQALHRAYLEAHDASSDAALGSQFEVREEARKVRALSDRMARMSPAHQDLANQMQNQVEAAANIAEEQGQLLAKKNMDFLDQSLSKAQEAVRQQASDDRESMNEIRFRLDARSGSIATATISGASSSTHSFLAKDMGVRAPSPPALYALFAGTCLLVLAYATLHSFARHRSVSALDSTASAGTIQTWMVRDVPEAASAGSLEYLLS